MGTGKVFEKDRPRLFIQRQGDWVQEGANNTIIILGTDRLRAGGPATVDDGDGDQPGTGVAHIIVGRHDPDGNPDATSDETYVYLARRTQADTILGTGNIGEQNDGVPSAILKTDAARFVVRKDIKIVLDGGKGYVLLNSDRCEIHLGSSYVTVEDDTVTVEGSKTIKLGKGASGEHVILGDTFVQEYLQHQHMTAVGPTSVPIPATVPKATDRSVLSDKSLVE